MSTLEETISLRELFETIKKRFLLIVSITMVAAIISAVVSYFILTPIYQSSTQLLVNQEKTEQSYYTNSDIQANIQLINTYRVIIKSPAIINLVREEMGLDLTTQQLSNKIQVNNEQNSTVVNLTVEDPDPVQASKIANTTAEIFKREVIDLLNVDNVSILSDAVPAIGPVKPRPALNIAIAVVVGLMAGVGLAFLLEFLDNSIKNEQDIEKKLGLPVLGIITTISEEDFDQLGMRESRKLHDQRGESLGA